MNKNDRSLLKQMIQAGRFNGAIYDLLCAQNKINAQEKIEEMGDKWCCHPSNQVKRLDVPLPLLNDVRNSKVLRKR
jgi:hypothetical protein